MIISTPPLVSVVTPVYNGEKYLAECIESVLAQTYQNWEYIIVNNCSTDQTLEIAKKYAEKDARIRIHNNTHFLNVIQNHNHAFNLIASESVHCKVLQADDWLFPECIEKMVEIAEKYPSIGIVGSYRLDHMKVNCDGLPYPSTVVSGRELCRQVLHGKLFPFGSPSTILIRVALLKKHQPFYNEDNIHADTESCFAVLRDNDFGFVHQVLSFTRRENEALTSFSKKFNTYILNDFIIMKKYGSVYLHNDEFKQVLHSKLKEYHRFLSMVVFRRSKKEIWEYHKNRLQALGYPIDYMKLLSIFTAATYNQILNIFRIKI